MSDESSDANLGLERLIFFSDAVMAIAITLLAVDLRVPEIAREVAAAELPRQLVEMAPKITSFVISFVIIGIYWIAHHRNFGYIKRYDTRLILLNLLFLLFIATLPFITGLLGEYSYLALPNMLYAFFAACIGLAVFAIWRYASHNHRLVDEQISADLIRAVNVRGLVGPLVFLLSMPFALINPLYTQIVWWLVPLSAWLVTRLVARKAKQMEH
jgi:uncharacterized membrane protein